MDMRVEQEKSLSIEELLLNSSAGKDFWESLGGYGFSSGHVWMWELDCEESWAPKKLMLLNCDVGEDSWESLGLQGDPTSPS